MNKVFLNRCGTLSLTDKNMGKCDVGFNILEVWGGNLSSEIATLVRGTHDNKLILIGGSVGQVGGEYDLRDSQSGSSYAGDQSWKSISVYPITVDGMKALRNYIGKNSIRLAGLD